MNFIPRAPRKEEESLSSDVMFKSASSSMVKMHKLLCTIDKSENFYQLRNLVFTFYIIKMYGKNLTMISFNY